VTATAHDVPAAVPAPLVQERPAAIRRRRRQRLARMGWNLVGLAVALVVIFPVFWMVSTALKPENEVNSLTPTWITTSPTLDHFRTAIDATLHPGFWDGVKNSLIVVALTVVFAIVLSFLAAVALAKYRFTGRRVFIALVIGILMLPQVGLIIPLYVVLVKYGLMDQDNPLPTGALAALILTYMTFLLPFGVWTLRGFILGVPKELEEAAMVDGSSRLGAFLRILLPLVAPGLVATSVFSFITAWNEFVFAITFLNDQDSYTVAAGLRQFFTQYGTDWGAVMAGSTLITLPVMIFFVIVQKRLSDGLVAGAVKG